jgi:hypothetical protein
VGVKANHRDRARILLARPFASGQSLVKSDAGRAPVWCVTTGLGTWTAQQDGQVFLTGNSHHYYDRGGLLPPGVTMAVNNTGTSERILSPSETHTYNQVRSATAGGGARTGGDGAALIAELQTQNRLLRALRGDVDQTGSFNALIGEIRGLRYQLAASGGSAAMTSQAARTASELGAWA